LHGSRIAVFSNAFILGTYIPMATHKDDTIQRDNVSAERAFDPSRAVFAGWAAIVIVGIMIFAKGTAYFLSGSVSVLSTLTDSLADIMMSATALLSVKMSLKPADECHRYGHGKIEGLFALIQSVFIIGAGAVVFYNAILNIINPEPITDQGFAAGVIILTLVLTFLLTRIQKGAIKSTDSLAIEADHAHYHSDIFINLGVLAVLIGTIMGLPQIIDPLFALIIAVYVWYIGYGVGKNAVDMLLDREMDNETRQEIIDIILSHSSVKDYHDLRVIRSGMKILITFDIEVDPNILLWSAHEIALEVEREIYKSFPQSEIMIHVDPAGSPTDLRHNDEEAA